MKKIKKLSNNKYNLIIIKDRLLKIKNKLIIFKIKQKEIKFII